MSPETLALLTDLLSRGGLIVVGIILVWALLTDKIVSKGRLDEERRLRQEIMAKLDTLIELLGRRIH